MNIQEKRFKIIVKPNAKGNKMEVFDKDKNAYRVSIKARPENNKANIEVIKFLSKTLKRRVAIVSGLKSREKTIKVLD